MNAHAKIQDGRRDFDFLQGRWKVLHRRLKLRGANCQDWEAFEGSMASRLLMGGLCNIDENDMPSPNAQGLAFRTFDIARGEWAIYWVSGEAGVLQAPVFGRFEDGVGRFYGVDVDDGRPVQVIYVWKDITPTSAHWAQAFSYDGGRSWEVNWTMAFERAE
jgi:hypothetical protein